MSPEIYSRYPIDDNYFSLFSTSHLGAILTIILITLLVVLLFKYTKFSNYRKGFRYFLIVTIILQEASFKVWRIYVTDSPLKENLNLNLCGITLILSIFLLANKSQKLYEIVFFWGLAGATQAILTPDIGQYGYPHFRFMQFFLSHGLIILVATYMTAVEGFRPKPGSIKRLMLITNAYALIVGIINYLLGTNYLFLARKPESASLLDFLGPWPWYIISLEALALLSFAIIYFPFYLSHLATKRANIDLSLK